MKKFFCIITSALCLFFLAIGASAQTINLNASALIPQVSLFLSPNIGSFEEDSTFTVPILIDTKGNNINSIDLRLKFDQNKLSIVGPSGENSIIGVWVEPPVYDNTLGTAKYVGVIPGGIITSSGLISSITFKAKGVGRATISLDANSKVLLNDGQGTATRTNLGRVDYTIFTKASPGVNVFSETHPFPSEWYNNNNPVFSWEKEAGITEFSYVLDNKPGTVPDNTAEGDDITVQFKDLKDGIWYFHIKSNKRGIWGSPSTFITRIDTSPPADFKPTTDYLLASVAFIERALVSFFTTDNLSGIDHYEVGVIDKSQPATASPIFIESESPFQVALSEGANLHVVVRAFDRAGNVRESGIDIATPFFINNFVKNNSVNIILGILIAVISLLILHYLFGHHFLHHFRKAVKVFKEDEIGDNTPPPPTVPPADLRQYT